jgi:2-dehydropantoate 2-reductase
MRILSLGAGAVGGYFGARLVQQGADVTFLVRDARKELLAKNGLVIESVYGNFKTPVHAVTKAELGKEAPFDVVMLTCKAYDLDDAIATIAPAVSERTTVLPLLNGLSHMDVLNARFGQSRVWGGLAKIAATLTPDGAIKHLNDWRSLTIGEQNGAMTDKIVGFAGLFDGTSAKVDAVPDIKHAMWEKFVHLASVAGMTTLMRAAIGEIARAPGGADLMVEMLETSARIAAAEGFPMSDEFMAEYRRIFTDRTIPYGASMLRDIERGGPIEGDHVVGYMLNKARVHKIPARLLEVSYVHLKAYEERRAAGRL